MLLSKPLFKLLFNPLFKTWRVVYIYMYNNDVVHIYTTLEP